MTSPPAPTCSTDFLWWGFLGLISILGYLVSLFLRKGVIERLDILSGKIEGYNQDIANIKINYVKRDDFEQWISVRKEVHSVLNGRIGEMETEQKGISQKMELYHKDISQKLGRLSKSFVARDLVLSYRIDNLADKIPGADKWSKERENEMLSSVADELSRSEDE